jgi:hypothetical protein
MDIEFHICLKNGLFHDLQGFLLYNTKEGEREETETQVVRMFEPHAQ